MSEEPIRWELPIADRTIWLVALVVVTTALNLASKDKPCPRGAVHEANKSHHLSYQETVGRATHQVEPKIPAGLGMTPSTAILGLTTCRGPGLESFGQIPPTYVNVDIIIDEQGRVVCARGRLDARVLDRICEDAAMQWTFQPILVGGRPVKVWGRLRFFIER